MAKRARKTQVFLIMQDSKLRSCLAADLRATGHLVDEYMTGREFLIDKPEHSRGAVVVDLRLPGMTGLELAEQLQTERAEFPVIVITGHSGIPMAIASGVADLLIRPVNAEAVASSVQRVTQGEVFDEDVLERTFRRVTARQREIMTLLATGKSATEIGAELGLSRLTVITHRTTILNKTRAKGIGHLVRMWRAWTELNGD